MNVTFDISRDGMFPLMIHFISLSFMFLRFLGYPMFFYNL